VQAARSKRSVYLVRAMRRGSQWTMVERAAQANFYFPSAMRFFNAAIGKSQTAAKVSC
jgi:hypothetical protein